MYNSYVCLAVNSIGSLMGEKSVDLGHTNKTLGSKWTAVYS